MTNETEFEAILADTNDFFKTYLQSTESVDPGIFYQRGMDLCRAAIHVQEGRMCGVFDSRLHLFKLAEACIEASYLRDMSKLDGTDGPPQHLVDLLLRVKFSKNYDEKYFVDNTYEEVPVFPNLWYGLDFAVEFLTTMPTLDFSGLPKEVVAQAIAADLVKVTAMIVWSTTLSAETGTVVEGTQDVMRQLYSLKYGVGIGDFDKERVAKICEEALPWVVALRDAVVGGRKETCLN